LGFYNSDRELTPSPIAKSVNIWRRKNQGHFLVYRKPFSPLVNTPKSSRHMAVSILKHHLSTEVSHLAGGNGLDWQCLVSVVYEVLCPFTEE
jgi:hypothetical protein